MPDISPGAGGTAEPWRTERQRAHGYCVQLGACEKGAKENDKA